MTARNHAPRHARALALRTTLALLAAFVAPLTVAQQKAHAADLNDRRLDAIASSIAGHDVHVWCEDDYAHWDIAALGYTYDPSYTHTIWIHPWVCRTLEDQLNGGVYPDDSMGFPKGTPVIMMALADSVHTLVHEAVHQIGGQYSDCGVTPGDLSCEGRTDCKALTLDEDVATRYFDVPETVQQQTSTWSTRRRKVHGHWRVTHVLTQTSTTIRNPDLDVFQTDIRQFHRSLPPQYQGSC